MAYSPMYRSVDVKGRARDLIGTQLNTDLGLATGKINPWEAPQWKPQVEGLKKQYSFALSDLAPTLKSAGVTGPGAALTLEKAGQGFDDSVLNLANMFKSDIKEEAWKGADLWTRLKQMAQQMYQAQQAQDAQKSAQKSSMITSLISKGMGIAAAPFLGGAMAPAGTSQITPSTTAGFSNDYLGSMGFGGWS